MFKILCKRNDFACQRSVLYGERLLYDRRISDRKAANLVSG